MSVPYNTIVDLHDVMKAITHKKIKNLQRFKGLKTYFGTKYDDLAQ